MSLIKQKLNMLRSCDVSDELFAVIRIGGIMTATAFVISLFWGIDTTMLFGLFIGWMYLCLCYIYLADTVCSLVKLSDTKTAQRKIRICYFIRFVGLFLLCWLSFELSCINVIGILVPQFFPKFIMYIQYIKKGKNNGRS